MIINKVQIIVLKQPPSVFISMINSIIIFFPQRIERLSLTPDSIDAFPCFAFTIHHCGQSSDACPLLGL
jgi:hypothetical protein